MLSKSKLKGKMYKLMNKQSEKLSFPPCINSSWLMIEQRCGYTFVCFARSLVSLILLFWSLIYMVVHVFGQSFKQLLGVLVMI